MDSANVTGHGISPAVRPSRLALFPAAAALALGAELVSFDGRDELGLLLADGVVGFVLLGAAVVAWDRRGKSLVGPLMGLAGLAWFAGNFWPAVLFLHRGPLVHLHLSYPTGRLRWRPAQVTVAAAYVSAAVEPFARNDVMTLVLAGLVAVAAGTAFLRTSGTARRAGVPALGAALAFAGVLALGAVNRLAGWQVDRGMLWVYDAVVAGVVLVLLADLLRGRWAEAVVTDLVVDLGGRADTGTLQDELGRALGDPSLVLGYWLPDEGRYVDDGGRPVDPTEHDPGRVVTPIGHDGEPVAVLVHDAAVLDDPGLVDAVAAAARLAVANARLQADARERVAALAASRRRIVEAAHAQRCQLTGELSQGVQRRLDGVAELLDGVRSCAEGPEAALLDEADAELRTARAEIDEFAQGIHPRGLTEGGLAAALPTLAGRTGLPVQLKVATGRLPPATEAVVYFVCSETLTNVTKYANAAHVSVDVRRSGDRVSVTIADDGIGGADPSRGSGLRGLADRVAALGGRLSIESPTEMGTQLLATLPIDVAGSEQA